ncbi:hypothetical protein [Candidatus Venteria ishoeyi]|uniref:ABC-2 family transporter protein n=1 Tax=Candidatus Venteria ishoeyi TaxID=1899563 RepID=A0A1H6F8B9_9GAMM|nr:hypothetical protein [Candidatus Venteria ishoeyi]SEH05225.1 Uncharacterised protein [Candidatus Venteria ishoeyi]
MNQIFDINRTLSLFKLNLSLNKKAILLAIAGFFGFVFITSFFVANNAPALLNNMHTIFYFILLYGGVALIAGQSYSHINSTEKSIAHLSLPASTFEKYIVPWLLSGIIWAIVAIGSYMLYSMLINGLWSGVMGFSYDAFNPFSLRMGPESANQVYLPYFLMHSVFFLGATAFQKHAIPKTLLTGFVVQSLFTFLNLIFIMILFGGFGDFNVNINHPENWNPDFNYFFLDFLPRFIKTTFVYVVPVIFYVAAFFKLKEREV